MIYLDNGATSWPKPACVSEAMVAFLETAAANPGRSGHRMAVEAERMIDTVRRRLSDLMDGPGTERTILTLNATDALNIAIKGVVRPGDHVITSVLEHNSVTRPLQAMAAAGHIELSVVDADGSGIIAAADVVNKLKDETRLVALTHCSNVLGTLQPAAEIGAAAREAGALFLLDASQSAGLVPISMKEMCIDLLAFPGHKALLGPTGTGALLVGERIQPEPFREGGTGGDSSSPVQPTELPWALEAGTPNTVGLAGLNAALEYLQAETLEKHLRHERAMAQELTEQLEKISGVRLFGTSDWSLRTGVVSFALDSMSPAEVGAILDESFGIAVRTGLHCAPGTHRSLGTFPDGTIRAVPGPTTSSKDVAALATAIREISL